MDRYRLLRSVVVGVLISVPLAFLISPREALAIGMLASLVVDGCLVAKAAWRMNEHKPSSSFLRFTKALTIWWSARLV